MMRTKQVQDLSVHSTKTQSRWSKPPTATVFRGAVLVVGGALLVFGVAALETNAAQKPFDQASPQPAASRAPGSTALAPSTAVFNSGAATEIAQNNLAASSDQSSQSAEVAKRMLGKPTANNSLVCNKPGTMGLARTVEIDTTAGPGFGFEHFKQYDFLHAKEVVLTFDDGPWPGNTPAVLKALTDECLKATFFEIGEHAMWHPEITKEVIAAGMTVGTHTWSHKDLAKNPYASNLDLAKKEIEMGISAVHMAADTPIAPFFRFPDLQHPPQLLSYLGERNIAIFSTDIDSFDFKIRKPEELIKSVMTKLQKRDKGIILMHDFKPTTAEAMPELIQQLKANGYKVVHMIPRESLATLPAYDEMIRQQDKLSANNTRPEASVVRTIGQ